MKITKLLLPALSLIVLAGCSVLGPDRAFVQHGPSSTTLYTVQPGDTLYSISRRYGLDPVAVARENAISNPSLLQVGQILRLSVSSAPSDAVARVQAAQSAEVAQTVPLGASSYNTETPPPPPPRSEPSPSPAQSAPASPAASSAPAPAPAPSADSGNRVVSAPSSSAYMWPVSGRVTKEVGPNHNGLDISVPAGTPVKAVADGNVVYVGKQDHFGNIVMVAHSGQYVSVYGHNSKINVETGAKVTKGQTIATSGTNNGGTPVLHFEIRKNGKVVNPKTIIR